jgi:hypothetical protein
VAQMCLLVSIANAMPRLTNPEPIAWIDSDTASVFSRLIRLNSIRSRSLGSGPAIAKRAVRTLTTWVVALTISQISTKRRNQFVESSPKDGEKVEEVEEVEEVIKNSGSVWPIRIPNKDINNNGRDVQTGNLVMQLRTDGKNYLSQLCRLTTKKTFNQHRLFLIRSSDSQKTRATGAVWHCSNNQKRPVIRSPSRRYTTA